ncbi:MAG TPA: DUF952 domain-containing protein [Pyrinomonadaceae bacterium]|nr:DUF952 domain-containing protein [Pyrinomonadaceae bacterium]
METIFHITGRGEWERARREGVYRTPSLESEGFIHCSRSDQVLRVADSLFRGRTGLVLLEIDAGRVKAEIRYENCEGGQEEFPHIYGALNLDSVVRVLEFEPGEDGSFGMPSA